MSARASLEEFESLLEKSFSEKGLREGSVVTGTVLEIANGYVTIDVGYKMEGRVELKEFSVPGNDSEISVGDQVEVFLERSENALGEAVLSREKALREEAWDKLEKAFQEEKHVDGIIVGRIKGGFTVNLGGAFAFLPGSQVDVRPVRDVTPLMNLTQPFQILKMDRRSGNIVISRRAILEESRAEKRMEIVGNLNEGDVVEGVVKNVTDYGAFVDLGGIDGLLHVTDMSWHRVNHPSEVISVGETVKVQIVRINKETQRISLGIKQLKDDPWKNIEEKYALKSKIKGRVANITEYGAFVQLEPGVEGLVHVSEMSWTKKNAHPGKILSTSQEVEVMVLEILPEKRRISLGLKQCAENPWESLVNSHPIGSTIEGTVHNITEFGIFVGLPGEIDGMAHLSDLSWNESGEEALAKYSKGDTVKAVVLDIDAQSERVSLGIKQLEDDPFSRAISSIKKGALITVNVTGTNDAGIEVEYNGVSSFIRRADLSVERSEQRPDLFAVGDKVDAKVTNIDKSARKISLSIKAREIAEEKEAVAHYGSTDSGASLGDILGAALKEREESEELEAQKAIEAEEKTKSTKKPSTGSTDKTDEKTTEKKAVKKSTKAKKAEPKETKAAPKEKAAASKEKAAAPKTKKAEPKETKAAPKEKATAPKEKKTAKATSSKKSKTDADDADK